MSALMFLLNDSIIDKTFINAYVNPVLLILMCLLSIAMIIIVMKQSSDPDGLGAITGGSETYYSQNKSKSRDAKLKKATIWVGIALVVVSIAYFILKVI